MPPKTYAETASNSAPNTLGPAFEFRRAKGYSELSSARNASAARSPDLVADSNEGPAK